MRMIYKDANQPLAPATDPWAIFKRLFTTSASAGGPSGDALLAERKSVLDLVQAELGDLTQRVSKEDQFKIAAHLASIRATETRLMAQATGGKMNSRKAPVDRKLKCRYTDLRQVDVDIPRSVRARDRTAIDHR